MTAPYAPVDVTAPSRPVDPAERTAPAEPAAPPDQPQSGSPQSGSSQSDPPASSDTNGTGGSTASSTLAGAEGFASRPRRPQAAAGPPTSATDAVPSHGGRHRRGAGGESGAAGTGPGRGRGKGKDAKKKGSFWRELPLLIVVAVVLTFVIQTFLGRIYVIPSASMERTLHGCTGCANDRVAVDKLTYNFTDPSSGDVVVFRGPPTWADNDEVATERSGNVLVRGAQDAASLVGFGPPSEKDFVKRVIATGGQEVACCDPQGRVTVDGRPLDEPYLFFQDGFGDRQEPFDPVTLPEGQLWVMGDNRNNSADARVHGPISIDDVIGKARAVVLPVGRWGGVPDTDPQAPAPVALPPARAPGG